MSAYQRIWPPARKKKIAHKHMHTFVVVDVTPIMPKNYWFLMNWSKFDLLERIFNHVTYSHTSINTYSVLKSKFLHFLYFQFHSATQSHSNSHLHTHTHHFYMHTNLNFMLILLVQIKIHEINTLVLYSAKWMRECEWKQHQKFLEICLNAMNK